MRRIALLTFIVVSVVLMGGYLLCIASPTPPWTPTGSKYLTKSWSAAHENAWTNTYVAYRLENLGGTSRRWKSYHWAYITILDPDETFTFTYEWKRGVWPDANDTNSNPVSDWDTYDWKSGEEDGIWESDFEMPYKDVTVTVPPSKAYPYSALRTTGDDVTEVNYMPDGITIQ